MAKEKQTAIFRSGGLQYEAVAGAKIRVPLLEAKAGDSVSFSEVLFVSGEDSNSPKIGTPLVAGAVIKAKVLGETKGEKLTIYKKRRRKGYTKKQGHRQAYTEVLVESINA